MAIEREKVLERDGKPAQFMGMSLRELLTLVALLFVVNLFGASRIVVGGTAAFYLLWIKKVRDFVPERYFSKMFRFYWMPSNLFKSGVRHAEWRNPVRRP